MKKDGTSNPKTISLLLIAAFLLALIILPLQAQQRCQQCIYETCYNVGPGFGFESCSVVTKTVLMGFNSDGTPYYRNFVRCKTDTTCNFDY